MKKLTVLTNDPSLTAWGWAVVDGENKVIDAGCIQTAAEDKKLRIRKGDNTIRRISEINHRLIEIIHKHKVNYLLSELSHGSKSAAAAVMIGSTAAIVQTIADVYHFGIEWYNQGDAKRCLLGKSSVFIREKLRHQN